jgi:pimeloyl-ACP methyl ester carboxylesterase
MEAFGMTHCLMGGHIRMRGALAALALLVAACTGSPGASPPAGPATLLPTAPPETPAGSTAPRDILGTFDVGGYSLYLTCRGAGSPTVLFESGLALRSNQWGNVLPAIAEDTRVCAYDRAGLGGSDPRSEPAAAGTTVGQMASEAWRLLDAAGIEGPIVSVGFSYGGLISRLFAAERPGRVDGVVLIDSSSPRQLEPGWPHGTLAADGSAPVDVPGSLAELNAAPDLGDVPLVVLTAGEMWGDFEIDWARVQDEHAALSSNALHMVAQNSGHGIQDDRSTLVIESVRATLEAARSGARIATCNERFTSEGALCLGSTMTDLLAAWAEERAAFQPAAGKLPSGTYRTEFTDADVQAALGRSWNITSAEQTWTFDGGRWTCAFVVDGEPYDQFEGIYRVTGDEITIVLHQGWVFPMTSNIHRFRWSVDDDGTLTFEQLEPDLLDPQFAIPFERVGGA